MDLGFDVIVTITGIVLVFLILVLLMAIITLEGKIFDAMNSNRCYRDRLTKEQILEQLRSNRGTQFDPEIVDCMLELIDSGEITFHAEET